MADGSERRGSRTARRSPGADRPGGEGPKVVLDDLTGLAAKLKAAQSGEHAAQSGEH